MKEILIMIIAPLAASVLTWVFTRNKQIAEVKGVEIDNTEKIIRMWRELSEGMEKRLKAEIDVLRHENFDLKQEIIGLQKENELLKTRLKSLIEVSVETETNRNNYEKRRNDNKG